MGAKPRSVHDMISDMQQRWHQDNAGKEDKTQNNGRTRQMPLSVRPKFDEIVQLPIWPQQERGIPNPFARSALFTVGNYNNKRQFFKNKIISSPKGTVITYTGEELRQDDEDVLLQILHIAREDRIGFEVEFTAYAMIKELGWTVNSRSYERLRAVIERLKVTSLTIECPGQNFGYAGSLVRSFAWQEQNGTKSRRWRVLLEPRIVALFARNTYTRIEWEQRKRLAPLAKWLHSFYSTHSKAYPLKVETIYEYCGSSAKLLRRFRQSLHKALGELLDVGFLASYEIDDNDLVRVERNSSVQVESE